MTPEEHRQVRKIILHSRIGCIVAKMSELFRISLTEALDVFYRSDTCLRFHDEKSGLYLYADWYLIDELEIELLGTAGDSELRKILFQSLSPDEQMSEVEEFRRFLKDNTSFLDSQPASIRLTTPFQRQQVRH
jgi:hypothetical protein